MGFIKGLKRALGMGENVTDGGTSETDNGGSDFNPVVIPNGIWGTNMVDAATSVCVAVVKRCLDIKCGSVASLGLHVYKRKTDGEHRWWEDDEGGSLDKLLSERPNHRQNAFDFIWDIVYQREMRGDAYVIPVYRDGLLAELVPVPMGCSVSYDQWNRLYTVTDEKDGIFGDFTEDEIIHLKGFSQDGFLGRPVTELAGRVLTIAMKTYKRQSEMFEPGSTLHGFITGEGGVEVGLGGGVDDSQLKDVTNRIRAELMNGYNLAYIPGTMKFVPTGMTPADLQLLDSMKFLNMEICRFFGVPPTQVFQDSNVNYKSTESSQTIFMTSTLIPLLKQMQSEMVCKLLTSSQRKRMCIRFKLDDYYQTDPTLMATSIKNLVQSGVLTPNEARERLGKKPLEGYDKLIIVGGKTMEKQ